MKQHRNTIPTSAVQISTGHPFGSGYSDADLRHAAEAEATLSMYDKTLWGENRESYLMRAVARGADVLRSLFGHQLDEQRLPVEQVLERLGSEIDGMEHEAIEATDSAERSQIEHRDLEDEIRASGHDYPVRRRGRPWIVGAAMTLIGFGELYILGPAYAILGLPDDRLVWFLPFTPQHLGALASVIALLALGHALGEDSRPPGTRGSMSAANRSWPAQLAASSAGHRLTTLGVVALLLGLAAVRELYLAAKGADNGWAALGFLCLNLGMVLAVRWMARPDPRPYAQRCRQSEHKVATTKQAEQLAVATAEARVGEYNAVIAEHDVVFSMHGNAAAAGASDAGRQIVKIAYWTRRAQPEPVDHPMFDEPLPAVTVHQVETDIRTYLIGATTGATPESPYHRYERVELRGLRERREQWRTRSAARWEARTHHAAPRSSTKAHTPVAVPPSSPEPSTPEVPTSATTSPNGASVTLS